MIKLLMSRLREWWNKDDVVWGKWAITAGRCERCNWPDQMTRWGSDGTRQQRCPNCGAGDKP